jgi:hypothetical protein
VPLFTATKKHEVQGFMLKLINNNCPGLKALRDGPRVESRVNLTVVCLVIPFHKKQPLVQRMFAAVTMEFNTLGVSLVLDSPRALEDVILGFRWEGRMSYVRARARHLDPIGAGFYQLGLELKEMIYVGDHPELRLLSL